MQVEVTFDGETGEWTTTGCRLTDALAEKIASEAGAVEDPSGTATRRLSSSPSPASSRARDAATRAATTLWPDRMSGGGALTTTPSR